MEKCLSRRVFLNFQVFSLVLHPFWLSLFFSLFLLDLNGTREVMVGCTVHVFLESISARVEAAILVRSDPVQDMIQGITTVTAARNSSRLHLAVVSSAPTVMMRSVRWETRETSTRVGLLALCFKTGAHVHVCSLCGTGMSNARATCTRPSDSLFYEATSIISPLVDGSGHNLGSWLLPPPTPRLFEITPLGHS